MTKHILLALSFLCIFAGMNCKKNPVAPPPPNNNDTTSNNFTFQTFAFGGNAGSCMFNDVAIISPTDIWAVGAVYLDSADGAPDPFPYNAAHWDGNSWTLMKITVQTKYGPVTAPFYGIVAFSSNDIWISSGLPIHGDGANWTQYDLYTMGVLGSNDGYLTRAWGSSSRNIYFVGTSGSIVHYANGSWSKITSGTSLQFNDIYGSGVQILAVCLQFDPPGGEIFSIQGNTATLISSSPIQGDQLYGIWFIPNQRYDLALDFGGIYEKRSLSDTGWVPLEITGAATTGVRGNSVNDIVVVSATGDLLQWNGVVWKSFRNQTGLAGNSYARVAISGNVVIAVGVNGTQAAITMGMRQ